MHLESKHKVETIIPVARFGGETQDQSEGENWHQFLYHERPFKCGKREIVVAKRFSRKIKGFSH